MPYKVQSRDRTLFATFSRGHPLSESKIHDFFDPIYANCIELIEMEEGEQPICACIMLYEALVMEVVLYEVEITKFMVNDKHLWVLEYEEKSKKLVPPVLG